MLIIILQISLVDSTVAVQFFQLTPNQHYSHLHFA